MAWLLVVVTAVLAVVVVALAVLVLRLRGRVVALESAPAVPAPVAPVAPVAPAPVAPPARETPEFVITRIGEPEEAPAPVPTVPVPVFADIVARETLVQAASWAAGLRRALDPETRNRIRFHVRQEVRRSRKQRKAELRAVRREWAARQREDMSQPMGDSAA